jgi:hypothetical protein
MQLFGFLARHFSNPQRVYVSGPRAGETEQITSAQVDEYTAIAEWA